MSRKLEKVTMVCITALGVAGIAAYAYIEGRKLDTVRRTFDAAVRSGAREFAMSYGDDAAQQPSASNVLK